jgi:hypothetical protein
LIAGAPEWPQPTAQEPINTRVKVCSTGAGHKPWRFMEGNQGLPISSLLLIRLVFFSLIGARPGQG